MHLFLSLLTLATWLLSVAALVPPISRDISSSPAPSSQDIHAFLAAHNAIRGEHFATPLQWSDDFARKASIWANACLFHRTEGVLSDSPYGELHVSATGVFPISAAIQQFAKDAGEYNPAHPTYNHWTQIVWKSTERVGCAMAKCNDLLGPHTGSATYYVCLYDPAGNVIGEASQNVQV